MKTILLLISTLLILQSCDEPNDINAKSIHFQFFVKNDASKDVSISLFFRNGDLLFKKINIGVPNSVLLDEGTVDPVGGSTYKLTNSLDSAVILFSDGKKLMQICCERGINDTINNVLTPVFYKSMEGHNNDGISRMMFNLTESDYLRAK